MAQCACPLGPPLHTPPQPHCRPLRCKPAGIQGVLEEKAAPTCGRPSHTPLPLKPPSPQPQTTTVCARVPITDAAREISRRSAQTGEQTTLKNCFRELPKTAPQDSLLQQPVPTRCCSSLTHKATACTQVQAALASHPAGAQLLQVLGGNNAAIPHCTQHTHLPLTTQAWLRCFTSGVVCC